MGVENRHDDILCRIDLDGCGPHVVERLTGLGMVAVDRRDPSGDAATRQRAQQSVSDRVRFACELRPEEGVEAVAIAERR
jgi:hypothetical protein